MGARRIDRRCRSRKSPRRCVDGAVAPQHPREELLLHRRLGVDDDGAAVRQVQAEPLADVLQVGVGRVPVQAHRPAGRQLDHDHFASLWPVNDDLPRRLRARGELRIRARHGRLRDSGYLIGGHGSVNSTSRRGAATRCLLSLANTPAKRPRVAFLSRDN